MINIIELSLIFLYLQLFSIILLNSSNLIMILITIELIILSIVLIACNLSFIYDDILGSFLALILLPLAGGESAVGLMLLISYYPEKGS